MAPIADTEAIKSYLIELGFEADDTAYRKFAAIMDKAASHVDKTTSLMSSSWIKAGGAIATTVGTVIASTTMLLDSLANADLGYQKYAMSMFMAKDAAKQFKIVTDSMNHSLEEISWIKELNVQYKQLMSEAAMMELPKAYERQMEMVRDIRFEFTRMKVEGSYALQWIGYHLTNKLLSPLGKGKLSLSEFNDYIRDNIPLITEKIAEGLYIILKPLGSAVELGKDLWSVVKDLWNEMGNTEKIVAAGAVLGGLFLASGPFGRALMVLGALVPLVDDFYGAMKGKETGLPIEVWWTFASAVDTVARGLMTITAILKSGVNFESTLSNYAKSILSLPTDLIFGTSAASKYHQKGLASWDNTAQLPGVLNNIWNPWAKNAAPGFLGKMPEDFYLGNEARVTRTKNLNDLAGRFPEGVEKYRAMLEETFGPQATLMAIIMQAESSGNPLATHANDPGKGTDWGLFQINDKAWGDRLKKAGIIDNIEDLKKASVNMKAAQYVLREQGLSAWDASKNGPNGWMPQGGQVNVTNNWNIKGSDPKEIADEIDRRQERNNALLYRAVGGLGNGG